MTHTSKMYYIIITIITITIIIIIIVKKIVGRCGGPIFTLTCPKYRKNGASMSRPFLVKKPWHDGFAVGWFSSTHSVPPLLGNMPQLRSSHHKWNIWDAASCRAGMARLIQISAFSW